jgi:hypothetical protein
LVYFKGNLVYFKAFWYILLSLGGIFCYHLLYLWLFGIFFPVLVCCTKKNLATLVRKVVLVTNGSCGPIAWLACYFLRWDMNIEIYELKVGCIFICMQD